MDPKKMTAAYQRLQLLDDRLTHKVRPIRGGSLVRPSPDQLEDRLRDLAAYTIELKAIVVDLFEAIAAKPE